MFHMDCYLCCRRRCRNIALHLLVSTLCFPGCQRSSGSPGRDRAYRRAGASRLHGAEGVERNDRTGGTVETHKSIKAFFVFSWGISWEHLFCWDVGFHHVNSQPDNLYAIFVNIKMRQYYDDYWVWTMQNASAWKIKQSLISLNFLALSFILIDGDLPTGTSRAHGPARGTRLSRIWCKSGTLAGSPLQHC